MTWETYERGFKRHFPAGTKVEQVRGGIEITLQCKHGHTVVETFNKRMPPDKAKVHLQNNGWRFWGKKTCCPKHNTKPEKPQKEEPEVEVPDNVVAMAAAKPAPSDATQNAKAAKRAAIQWLEELFDENKGRYKIGFSDAYVAKETGLSIEAVAKLRDDFGYEIKEPVEFAQWRLEMEKIDRNLKAVKEGVEEKIAKLQSDAADTVQALQGQAAALREKIESTIKERGW